MSSREKSSETPDISLAIAGAREVLVEINGRRTSYAEGQQSQFVEDIGLHRLCFCDDVFSLVETLAGPSPGVSDAIWRVLDDCRLIDARVAVRAAERSRALCPEVRVVRTTGTVDQRLDELRQTLADAFRELDPADLEIPTHVSFGPLGAGFETRVAVALFIAQASAGLRSDTREVDLADEPGIPRFDDQTRCNRFLAERSKLLVDTWNEQIPVPRTIGGQYSSDLRDWGLMADANPRLVAARRKWALANLQTATNDVSRERQLRASALRGRTLHDYGGLRSAGFKFQAASGRSLIRVCLRNERLVCYGVIGKLHRWFGAEMPGICRQLAKGEDPAVAFVDNLAQQDFLPSEAESSLGNYLKLSLPDRNGFVRSLLEAMTAGFEESVAVGYIARLNDRLHNLPPIEQRQLVRDFRWSLLNEPWLGLDSYSTTDGVDRIIYLARGDTDLEGVKLRQKLRRIYGENHSADDLSHWEEHCIRTFTGAHAGYGDAARFWKILSDGCSDEERRRSIREARTNPKAALTAVSASPRGMTGRIGVPLPCWQVRAAEVDFAVDEVRGQLVYALVRYGCGLIAVDGGEFLCLANGASQIERIRACLSAAVANLIDANRGAKILQRLITSNLEFELIDDW